MTRAILFDMDGVLIDSMAFHAYAWCRAVKEMTGIDVPEAFIYACEGKNAKTVIRDAADHFAVSISADLGAAISTLKDQYFAERYSFTPVPGAAELVQSAANLDYKLGVATGSKKFVAEEALERLGVRQYFSGIIAASDVQHSKPHPQPYQLLLEKLGGSIETSFVIENAPLGVQSAKAAGLFCMAVTTTNSAAVLSEADYVPDGHKTIKKLLETEYEISQGKGPWLFDL